MTWDRQLTLNLKSGYQPDIRWPGIDWHWKSGDLGETVGVPSSFPMGEQMLQREDSWWWQVFLVFLFHALLFWYNKTVQVYHWNVKVIPKLASQLFCCWSKTLWRAEVRRQCNCHFNCVMSLSLFFKCNSHFNCLMSLLLKQNSAIVTLFVQRRNQFIVTSTMSPGTSTLATTQLKRLWSSNASRLVFLKRFDNVPLFLSQCLHAF